MRNSGTLCCCSWIVFLIAPSSSSLSSPPPEASIEVRIDEAVVAQHQEKKPLDTDKEEGKSLISLTSVPLQCQSSSSPPPSPSLSSSTYSPSSRVLYISSTIDIIDRSRSSTSTSNSPTTTIILSSAPSSSSLSSSSKSLSSATTAKPILVLNTLGGSQETSTSPRRTFMDIQSLHPVLKSFLVGSVSGTCSTILFQPLDLVKTRLQQRPAPAAEAAIRYHYNGMITVVGHIVRDEKWSGLWKGMTPALSRCVPGVGLYFASIHGLKMATGISGREPTPLEGVCLGITSRALSGVTLIPFTVVKTRFESQHYQYKSMRSALATIYTQEGYRGLTSGLVATLARDAPFSGIYLMLYTSIKRLVPAEYWNANNGTSSQQSSSSSAAAGGTNAANSIAVISSSAATPYLRFSCGILAGLGASIVTQPADVIKTKMQLYPDRFHGVSSTVVYVYKKYGVQGYFKGLVPRMVRRTLVAAMSWTIYEQLMNSIGLK